MALCKEYLEQIQALYLCYLSKTDNFIFGKEIPYLMLINFVALIIVSPVHPSIIPCHCSKSVLKLATKTKQFLAAILVGQVLNSHSCFFPPDSSVTLSYLNVLLQWWPLGSYNLEFPFLSLSHTA